MNPGSYALKFRGVDKKYLEEIGDAHLEERSNLLARSRRLSADTAKRRKALALKRKLEAQKEEKRRLEILQKRREQIREATEKYQRGNKNYSAKDYESYDRHKTPALEEALSAVRGRAGSANRTSYRSYSATMATGGVAQTRISSAGSVQSTRSVTSNGSARPHAAHYNYTGNKGDHNQTHLHTHSLRNLNNSRSLFEQQLQHHQQLLMEQQKQSLHQFNAEIQKEMDHDPKLQGVEQLEDIDVRPDSPDSVDSLEVNSNQDVKPLNGVTKETMTKTLGPTCTSHNYDGQPSQNNLIQNVYNQKIGQGLMVVNSSYVRHGVGSSQSPVAVVQPQVKQCSVGPVREKSINEQASFQDETKSSEPLNVINATTASRPNGLYNQNTVIGRASEVQPCDAVKENIPIYHEPGHEFNTVMKTKAWVTPSPLTEQEKKGLENSATSNHNASSRPQELHHPQIAPYAMDITNTNFVPVQQNAVPLPASTTAAVQQKAAPLPVSTTAAVQQTAVPLPVSTTAAMLQKAVPLPVSNTAAVQQTAVPLPVSTTAAVQQTAVPLPVSTTAAMLQKAVPLPVSTTAAVQQTAVPLPVSTTAPVQQRPAPSSTSNTMSYFTVSQQNAAGARPVTSVVISVAGSNTQPSSYSSANMVTAPSMEVLKQYSQFPMYKVVSTQEAEEQNSQISESSTLTSGSDVAEESHPEPHVQRVRGILKKFSSYGPPLPNQHAAKLGRSHVLTRSVSAHTGLRDSLEITKIKRECPVKRPKSVRFADVVYTDESDSDSNQPQNKPTTVSEKPPASRSQRTRVIRNQSKIPRASSAGTESRKPFLRPHPPSDPPTGRAVVCRNSQKKSSDVVERHTTQVVNSNTNSSSIPAENHVITAVNGNGELSKPQAVYDVNGVRLDRTPTDEEINFLWDKVRTCLSRQSNSSTTDSVQTRNNTTPVAVSQKNIDGSSLAPQFRVTTRVNSTYTNNYMGTTTVTNTQARKKVSMDVLNNFVRRQSLLNQRSKQMAAKASSGSAATPVSMTTHLIKPTPDAYQATNYTTPSGGSLPHQTTNQPVSESLAAFLAAENLAKESVSDSQIEAAMDRAVREQQVINTGNPQPKVPTALSIEEQRLMQSLERLNERLRLNETQMYPVSFAPNPPPYHAGFKGHQPIASSSAAKRQVSSSGTVPRHMHRSGSAPVQRTTNYTGPYRYR